MNIAQFLPQTPTKYTCDAAAIGIAFGQFMGFWRDNVGVLATTVGLAWLLIQIFFFLKDRMKK